jgi:hypothetical protein
VEKSNLQLKGFGCIFDVHTIEFIIKKKYNGFRINGCKFSDGCSGK